MHSKCKSFIGLPVIEDHFRTKCIFRLPDGSYMFYGKCIENKRI